jgi:hypothetical protein
MIPPMATQTAPHLEFAGQIKRKLSVPLMHAARIADVATARYAIAEGLLNLVGMTRALMADPELPNKVRTGRTDEIRPCVGANMCIDGIYNSGSAFCIHNPSTGRELEVPQRVERASTSRRVAVVGAGPPWFDHAVRTYRRRVQCGRAVPDLPHRGCGLQPERTRGDARRCAALSRDLTPRSRARRPNGASRYRGLET